VSEISETTAQLKKYFKEKIEAEKNRRKTDSFINEIYSKKAELNIFELFDRLRNLWILSLVASVQYLIKNDSNPAEATYNGHRISYCCLCVHEFARILVSVGR
jgi:FKBP-type peptidyl-prolyl cis-trans isomerase (trigger factor)